MLGRNYNVAVRGPPSAEAAVVCHVRTQTMAEDDYLPLLVLLWIIKVERCVSKDRHFDLLEEGTHKPKEEIGNSELPGVNVKYLIQIFIVLFCRNPFTVRAISSRWIENTNLHIIYLVQTISGIVRPLPHQLYLIKFYVNHQQSQNHH